MDLGLVGELLLDLDNVTRAAIRTMHDTPSR